MVLGTEKAWLVHGADGLDEMTTTDITNVLCFERKTDIAGGSVCLNQEIDATDLGLARSTLTDLKGGEPGENAHAIRQFLNGAPGPFRDIVLLNSAAALVVAGKAVDLSVGLMMAAEANDSGAARQMLRQLAATTQMLAA